jgi:hypothetical protein
MDKATKAAEKEMFRVIKYVIDTEHLGLKLAPTLNLDNDYWTMTLFSDSDWASNKQDRKSITGYAIFFQDAPIFWKSQSQQTVSLSSTEAEYYATSEAAKEIKFIVQVLESLQIKVKKPIIVYLDNVGAIFVAENPSATKHTRHIDARYHFVREYILDGTIRVMFVMSRNNKADIFTKNVTSEIFEEHIGNYMIQRQIIDLTYQPSSNHQYFDSGGVSGFNPYYKPVNSGNNYKNNFIIKSHNSKNESRTTDNMCSSTNNYKGSRKDKGHTKKNFPSTGNSYKRNYYKDYWKSPGRIPEEIFKYLNSDSNKSSNEGKFSTLENYD